MGARVLLHQPITTIPKIYDRPIIFQSNAGLGQDQGAQSHTKRMTTL